MGTERISDYSNSKLATFIGGKVERSEPYTSPHGSMSEGTIHHWKVPDGTPLHRFDMARIGIFDYDKNWESIHTVIDRIESLGYEVIMSRRKIQIWKFIPDRMEFEVTGLIVDENLLDDYVGDQKKRMTVAALVSFVEWYDKHGGNLSKQL